MSGTWTERRENQGLNLKIFRTVTRTGTSLLTCVRTYNLSTCTSIHFSHTAHPSVHDSIYCPPVWDLVCAAPVSVLA